MSETENYSDDGQDLESIMKQLNETTDACRRCMSALDGYIFTTAAAEDGDKKVTEQLMARVAMLEDQLRNEKERNFQLHRRSQQLEAENRKLVKDFDDCQKRLQEAKESNTSLANAWQQKPATKATADQERIHMLEVQLEVFREDFEAERREHASDLVKISSLEQALSMLRTQLQRQSSSGSSSQLSHPVESRHENVNDN